MPLNFQFRRRGGNIAGVEPNAKQAIVDLESSVADAVAQICASARNGWRFVGGLTTVQAQPWDLVFLPEGGTVFLPSASPDNRATEVTVVARSASVTVVPIGTLVNGAATHTPTASRATKYVSSGEGWYSNA
jgi:hypothetical protein